MTTPVRKFRSARAIELDLEGVRERGYVVEDAARRLFDVRDPVGRKIVLLMEDLRRKDLPQEDRVRMTERVHGALYDLSDQARKLAEMVMTASLEAGPLYDPDAR